jgi:hypothetical protein
MIDCQVIVGGIWASCEERNHTHLKGVFAQDLHQSGYSLHASSSCATDQANVSES